MSIDYHRAFESFAPELELDIRQRHVAYVELMRVKPQSPIEDLLLYGLHLRSYRVDLFKIVGHDWPKEGLYTVHLQRQIGRHRVDFAIEAVRDNPTPATTLIVECDGHDFHDRTVEQLRRDRQRDRVLVEQGYTVLRFTGGELYRDLAGCISSIERALLTIGQRA